jgi:phosphoesterase RecJ-like protein
MHVDWSRFVDIVAGHERFILTSHIRPDCDALGSELGMAGILESLNKEVRIVNGQKTPPNFAFIDPGKRIRALGDDVTAADVDRAEVLIVLDTSAWAQLGPMADVVRSSRAKKLVVDHHVSEDDLGAIPFKDVTAEATGRLVLQAADALNVTITPEIATPLFAAIATDTGWFRFASTSGATLRAAARLLDAGTVPAVLYRELYEQDTLARVQLIGRILARAQTELNGRLVHTAALLDDFNATGALPSDTEDIVNMTLTIAGTQAAVIFVEQRAGGVKISFRSRKDVDCSQLAERFGGGGHRAAAGAMVKESLDSIRPKVLDAVRSVMQ